ncbi:MAG: isoprenylcysteine carboxylmethyltransferase family protein [Balneolales bacterium]
MALKVPPVVLYFLAAMLIWVISELAPGLHPEWAASNAIALTLVIIGIIIGALGGGALRFSGTTVNPHAPDRASTLVVFGIYRYSRNPMYLGLVLLLIAWGIFLSSVFTIPVVIGFIMYMNRYQIEPEEKSLEDRFNQDYKDYKQRVRRWL